MWISSLSTGVYTLCFVSLTPVFPVFAIVDVQLRVHYCSEILLCFTISSTVSVDLSVACHHHYHCTPRRGWSRPDEIGGWGGRQGVWCTRTRKALGSGFFLLFLSFFSKTFFTLEIFLWSGVLQLWSFNVRFPDLLTTKQLYVEVGM